MLPRSAQIRLHCDALERVAQDLAAAAALRAAAIARAGEILRRDQAAGDLVGITRAEDLTGLSRPILTAARVNRAPWAQLARAAADMAADGQDNRTLMVAVPAIGYLTTAVHLLNEAHRAAWHHAAYGTGCDPLALPPDPAAGPPEPAPGVAVLLEARDAIVDRLADGEPW